MEKENQLTWHLADPRMGFYERAGLAALYMSLRAAETSNMTKTLLPLYWEDSDLTDDSITVRWREQPKPAFEKLMSWSWQVDDKGKILYFPAVHDLQDLHHWWKRVATHNGVMRTFLQHTNVQPKGEPISRVAKLDDEKEVLYIYQPPIVRVPKSKDQTVTASASGKLLKPWKDVTDLFDRKGEFVKKPIKLSNWVYPGIAGRFSNEGAWEGSPEIALLLMLAPTVCFYQRLIGEGGNWVFVVPDVRSLADFAVRRKGLSLDSEFVDVASLGDAGFRFLANWLPQTAGHLLQASCNVVAMGKVGYYSSQSIRKGIENVSPRPKSIGRYEILQDVFPNYYAPIRNQDDSSDRPKPADSGRKKRVTRKAPAKSKPEIPQAKGRIRCPSVRGRIADNLLQNRPWYSDLVVPTRWERGELENARKYRKSGGDSISLESLQFQHLCFQRSKLMRLIKEDDMWDSEAEKSFVEAFWETLDSLYAKEAEATKRGGSRKPEERFDDLNDSIRRRLMQAKTRVLLRGALMEFFAKAGRQRQIRSHPAAIWRLIDHPEHWHKGRDLALLALASHRSKASREEKNETIESDVNEETVQ